MNQLSCNLLSKSDFALSPITVTLFSCHTLGWYKIKQYETTKVLYVTYYLNHLHILNKVQ